MPRKGALNDFCRVHFGRLCIVLRRQRPRRISDASLAPIFLVRLSPQRLQFVFLLPIKIRSKTDSIPPRSALWSHHTVHDHDADCYTPISSVVTEAPALEPCFIWSIYALPAQLGGLIHPSRAV